jgi:hypothetical protein
MSRQRFVLLLIAALVVITGAVFLSSRRDAPQETVNAPLLPSLASDMAAVNAVLIRKGAPAPTLTVHKVGNQWTVAELQDYPADVSKLRTLLLSLRDAKTIEEKTSDPARYATLGVEDPSQPNAVGTEVTIVAPGSKKSVIVGKSVGQGSFVRRAGDARFWIDPHLIDLPSTEIQRIDVKPATGTSYSLHRLKIEASAAHALNASKATRGAPGNGVAESNGPGSSADDSFALEGVPPGRQALDARLLAPPSTMLTGLTADDVSPVNAIDFSQSSQAVVTRNDGAVLTLTGVVIGTKHWLQVQSTKDAALNARAQGRAFEIASYRYDGIFRPVDQLLVPKPTPIPKSASTSKAVAKSTPAGRVKTPQATPAP